METEEQSLDGKEIKSNPVASDSLINNELVTIIRNDDLKWLRPFKSVELLAGAVFLADALAGSVVTNFILIRTCEVHFHFNKSICNELGHTNKNESDIEAIVQPYSAVILTGMNFMSVCLPAIMSLFLGAWSDYNGRKPLLIAPAVGYFLKYLFLALFSYIPNLDPTFGLVAVLPVALTGGIVNFICGCHSYISDITSVENRFFRISVFESVIYLGSIIGMLSTSSLYNAGGNHGNFLVFGVCAAIVFLAVLISGFSLPESNQTTENGGGILHLFDLKFLKEMLGVCFKKREGSQRAVIFLVIFSLTISICAMEGESNVLFLYTRLRFGWNIKEYTFWSSTCLACTFLGLLLGTVVFSRWLKLSDAYLGVLSYAMKTASCFYLAFIPPNAPNMMYYGALISIFSGLCGPAGRAVLSKSVPREDLGKVFALTGSAESLFPLEVAPLYTWLYNSTINTFQGAFFIVSGSLFLLCTAVYIIIHFIHKPNMHVRLENEEE